MQPGRTDRVHAEDQRDDLPCDWCGEIRLTTVNEIWSEAFPVGWLCRLCEECGSGCAGG